jgi:hypothetical protein
MVLTLSLRTSDFILADTRNSAVPTPECPMVFSVGGSETAIDGYVTLGAFSSNRANHDFITAESCQRDSFPPSTAGFAPRRLPMNLPSLGRGLQALGGTLPGSRKALTCDNLPGPQKAASAALIAFHARGRICGGAFIACVSSSPVLSMNDMKLS